MLLTHMHMDIGTQTCKFLFNLEITIYTLHPSVGQIRLGNHSSWLR